MNMKILYFAAFFTAVSTIINGQQVSLSVRTEGFRNDLGQCLVYVYSSGDGFPTKQGSAFMKVTGKISDRESVVVINDLKPGIYAVSIVHDENANGRIDLNFIGMPKEGVGASNNPRSFGPPSFESAQFSLGKVPKTITINLRYF